MVLPCNKSLRQKYHSNMVKYRGNRAFWYDDYGETRLLWNLSYHGAWFYYETNHHGRNTIVSLIRCFTIVTIQYHGNTIAVYYGK